MIKQRFALRFLLPAEILMAVITLSWGLAGSIGTGRLTEIVAKADSSAEWTGSLGLAGLFQFIVAVAELMRGRDWNDHWLSKAADLRHFAAFVAMIVWVVIIGMCISHEPLRSSVALTIQAIVLLAANAIVSFHTKRLSVLLDASIPTEGLKRELLEARVIRG